MLRFPRRHDTRIDSHDQKPAAVRLQDRSMKNTMFLTESATSTV